MREIIVGVYRIVNKVNGKIYIGSSADVNRRVKQHYNQLIGNNHENRYLQNACNKYGIENFEFSLV